jgi:hypothetical protein
MFNEPAQGFSVAAAKLLTAVIHLFKCCLPPAPVQGLHAIPGLQCPHDPEGAGAKLRENLVLFSGGHSYFPFSLVELFSLADDAFIPFLVGSSCFQSSGTNAGGFDHGSSTTAD